MKQEKRENLFLKVSGPRACFSNPQCINDCSYDFPPYSACRGILESIYWKPQVQYNIDSIQIVKMGYRESISWSGQKSLCNYQTERLQLITTFLTDVSYIIKFRIIPLVSSEQFDAYKKNIEIFKRRVRKGQSFRPVLLGKTEFIATEFTLTDGFEKNSAFRGMTKKYGPMLHHIEYDDESQYQFKMKKAYWFNAEMIDGIVSFEGETYHA